MNLVINTDGHSFRRRSTAAHVVDLATIDLEAITFVESADLTLVGGSLCSNHCKSLD